MVAIFTTCLPSSKRDQLPPQYNVARYDVLIMIIVTVAALLVDIATPAFFVMGLAIFTLTSVHRRCSRNKESNSNIEDVVDEEQGQADTEVKPKRRFFAWRGKKNKKKEQQHEQGGEEGHGGTTQEVNDAEKVVSEQNGEEGWCNIAESAEEIIFPKNMTLEGDAQKKDQKLV